MTITQVSFLFSKVNSLAYDFTRFVSGGLLVHKNKPKLIIELKFKKKRIGIQKKDAKVLEKSVENKKWAKKAYFIQLVVDPKKATNQGVVPYRNKTIPIIMKAKRKAAYDEMYDIYRKPQPRGRKRVHSI